MATNIEALKGAKVLVVTMVDNAGVTRAKLVPATRIERVASAGVGISKTLSVYCADDHVTTSNDVPGPDGDLRLVADLAAARPLAHRDSWWWAPANSHTVDGDPYPGCQRRFLETMVDRLRQAGLTLRTTFEIEWYLQRRNDTDSDPSRIATGPAYGLRTIDDIAPLVDDLVATMTAAGIPLEQVHAEYGNDQFEVSVGAQDPVAAADTNVLARHLVRGISRRHGYNASFSPMFDATQIGSGSHVHLSLQRDGVTVFADGTGIYGLGPEAVHFLGGIVEQLQPLTAVIAGSPASGFRLSPSMWAGAFACWGQENREAAVRLITPANQPEACNAEVKVVDSSANPYLALGALIAAGLNGLHKHTPLPEEISGDPARQAEEARPPRLPATQADALAVFRSSDVLAAAMGAVLFDNFAAVRAAEIDRHATSVVEDVLAVHRWCY